MVLTYNVNMMNTNINNEDKDENVIISRKEYDALLTQKAELEMQNQWLLEQLKLLKKGKFGSSSEKANEDVNEQLSFLFNEAEVMDEDSVEIVKSEDKKKKTYTRRQKSGSLKDVVPDNLPVEIVDHGLSGDELNCPVCGSKMEEIGQSQVRDELVIKLPEFSICRHVYHTYICRNCEKNSESAEIVKQHVMPAVLPKSFASPELVSYIMTQKFVMHSPLYRLEQEFERQSIHLSRQTMSNWILHASDDWLRPIYEELHRRLVTYDVLHADETTLQVLKEPEKKAQTKSYMWVYRTSGDAENPIVLYEYQPNRKAENAENFLKGFHGWLHTDGYSGYHALQGNVKIVGCLAHVRRKFDEALTAIPENNTGHAEAAKGVAYCSRLFAMDKEFKDLPPDERKRRRLECEKPIADDFLAWAEKLLPSTTAKSKLGGALRYLKNQEEYLANFWDDGRLEIDNNRAERSVKPFVIGRKNWLFANTPAGAQASAVIFSIIETAIENDLDPYRYLLWIFKTAPILFETDMEWVTKLLPENAPTECRK